MSLSLALHEILSTYLRRHFSDGAAEITINAPDAWQVDAVFTLPVGRCRLRSVRVDDVPVFHAFGTVLGEQAQHFFSPYPWNEPDQLDDAFSAAIYASLSHVDASYFLELDGAPVGHCFLWKAGGNPHALQHGVAVPELGIAVADVWQGHGFGGLMMRALTVVARSLQADAIELTTALDNENGWVTYLRAGYDYTGIIPNPQFVDVTAVAAGTVTASVWRDERQMIRILNEAKREGVLHYLAVKRDEAAALAARSAGAHQL